MTGNIVDFVGHRERIFPIGRLDKDSEGLILLTNDGDIVNEILRVENGHEKEYLVTVEPPVTDNFLSMMAKGVRIGGEKTKPCTVTRTGRDEFRMVLTQGLNRQIRRMCSALGWRVKRLVRIRIMHIRLGTLESGRWRDSTESEQGTLLRMVGRRPGRRRIGPDPAMRRITVLGSLAAAGFAAGAMGSCVSAKGASWPETLSVRPALQPRIARMSSCCVRTSVMTMQA